MPVIGSTDAEARKLESHLHEHIGHSYALHRPVTLLDVELTEKDSTDGCGRKNPVGYEQPQGLSSKLACRRPAEGDPHSQLRPDLPCLPVIVCRW